MKKLFSLIILLPILSGCLALSKTKVGSIALISDVKYTDENVVIDNNNFSIGRKEGRACASNVLGLVANGDMSIEKAKENGRISNITAVTTEVKNMLIMSNVCTVVKGN